jgi:hypothetical protein
MNPGSVGISTGICQIQLVVLSPSFNYEIATYRKHQSDPLVRPKSLH